MPVHASICTEGRIFLRNVPNGVGDECVGHAASHHRGADINAVRPTDRLRFIPLRQPDLNAGNRLSSDQLAEIGLSLIRCRPTIRTDLSVVRRINAMQPIRLAFQFDGISADDRLGSDWQREAMCRDDEGQPGHTSLHAQRPTTYDSHARHGTAAKTSAGFDLHRTRCKLLLTAPVRYSTQRPAMAASRPSDAGSRLPDPTAQPLSAREHWSHPVNRRRAGYPGRASIPAFDQQRARNSRERAQGSRIRRKR